MVEAILRRDARGAVFRLFVLEMVALVVQVQAVFVDGISTRPGDLVHAESLVLTFVFMFMTVGLMVIAYKGRAERAVIVTTIATVNLVGVGFLFLNMAYGVLPFYKGLLLMGVTVYSYQQAFSLLSRRGMAMMVVGDFLFLMLPVVFYPSMFADTNETVMNVMILGCLSLIYYLFENNRVKDVDLVREREDNRLSQVRIGHLEEMNYALINGDEDFKGVGQIISKIKFNEDYGHYRFWLFGKNGPVFVIWEGENYFSRGEVVFVMGDVGGQFFEHGRHVMYVMAKVVIRVDSYHQLEGWGGNSDNEPFSKS